MGAERCAVPAGLRGALDGTWKCCWKPLEGLKPTVPESGLHFPEILSLFQRARKPLWASALSELQFTISTHPHDSFGEGTALTLLCEEEGMVKGSGRFPKVTRDLSVVEALERSHG